MQQIDLSLWPFIQPPFEVTVLLNGLTTGPQSYGGSNMTTWSKFRHLSACLYVNNLPLLLFSPPPSMLFWLPAFHRIWCPSWLLLFFLFQLLTRMTLHEAAAGHMKLSSQDDACCETCGRWPHMACSCLVKSQARHTSSPVGARRQWKSTMMVEHRWQASATAAYILWIYVPTNRNM